MSIFGSIVTAIFGSAKAETTAPGSAPTAGGTSPSGGAATSGGAAASAPLQPGVTPPSGPTPLSDIDVAKVLGDLAAHNKEKLDWRRSIVDLMKLLKLDSGLAARKELAKELGYSGDTNDSAKMNVWLHQQVMHKLAENGGKVPADLVH